MWCAARLLTTIIPMLALLACASEPCPTPEPCPKPAPCPECEPAGGEARPGEPTSAEARKPASARTRVVMLGTGTPNPFPERSGPAGSPRW